MAVAPASTARRASSAAADALDHERSRPVLPQPRHVVPRRRRRRHPRAVRLEEPRCRRIAGPEVGHRQVGQLTRPQPVEQPARSHEHLRGVLDRRPQVDGLRDLRAAPVPAVHERPVRREDQAARAGGLGAIDAGQHRLTVTRPIGLEQRHRLGRDHLFDRLAGERAQPHRHASRRGGAGDGQLAVGVHGLHAGRRDDHRHRDLQIEDRRRHVAGRRLSGGHRPQPELGERGDVVLDRDPAIGSGDERSVHGLREASLGTPLGDGHGFEPSVAHVASTLPAVAGR